MVLSFENMKDITQGAEEVFGGGRSISFSRFNRTERALYQTTKFAGKIPASAGVQMVFRTDGDELAMQVRVDGAASRSFFMIDVFVNDCLVGAFGNLSPDEKDIFHPFELGRFGGSYLLGPGEKTVRIVFPWSVSVEVLELSLEHASFVTPVKRSRKMIAYGDSITHGYDALHPSNSYVVKLAHNLDAELFNKGMGGEIFFPPLSAIKASYKPDIVTVAYGTNDWGTVTSEEFEQNAAAFYGHLSANYPRARIFAITPIWRKDRDQVRAVGRFEDLERIIKKATEKYKNVVCISGITLVPHDGVYFSDGFLHPNDVGFAYYANNLTREINKYL